MDFIPLDSGRAVESFRSANNRTVNGLSAYLQENSFPDLS